MRVTLCPTLLYPEDPEMPRTTKVRARPLDLTFAVKGLIHTSAQIFFEINKKQHKLSYIQS